MATARTAARTSPIRRRQPRGQGHRGRWRIALAVTLVLGGVFVTGVALGRSAGGPSAWLTAGAALSGVDAEAMPASRPVSLRVPSITLTAPVGRVGLAPDGTIAVPPLARHSETGWYDGGPTPGETGPAIIVGHADTRTGPSVFHQVRRLRSGDRIEVTRADRSVAVFEVSSVERFHKDDLPLERVYGDYSRPGLRLITCGGEFVGGSIGYADNVIAFATLIGSRDA